jgi:DNA-binding GntR family transcriptional regulator
VIRATVAPALVDTIAGVATNQSAAHRNGQNVGFVYEVMREAILLGELAPGSITTQTALAERYGVGRTPLREALRLLQSERLVVDDPNRRVQITPLTAEDAEELSIARVLLEPAAVRLTVPTLTSRDDAEMRGYMAQMDHYEKARDWINLREPHRAFHAKLYAAAGPRLVGMLSQLFDHAERYRLRASPPREFWKLRQSEHRAIFAAAAARDADRTAELLCAHYAHTAGLACRALDPEMDPVRLRETLRTVAPGAEAELDRRAGSGRRGRA